MKYLILDEEKDDYMYYVAERTIEKKFYKMIFWMKKRETNVIGVVTIYRTGSMK